MRVKIISVYNGTGKVSKKSFRKVCAMLQSAKGSEYAEFFYDEDLPEPLEGHVYDIGYEAYTDRQKMLQIRVGALREFEPNAKPPIVKPA
jgi:hypothetical protein